MTLGDPTLPCPRQLWQIFKTPAPPLLQLGPLSPGKLPSHPLKMGSRLPWEASTPVAYVTHLIFPLTYTGSPRKGAPSIPCAFPILPHSLHQPASHTPSSLLHTLVCPNPTLPSHTQWNTQLPLWDPADLHTPLSATGRASALHTSLSQLEPSPEWVWPLFQPQILTWMICLPGAHRPHCCPVWSAHCSPCSVEPQICWWRIRSLKSLVSGNKALSPDSC